MAENNGTAIDISKYDSTQEARSDEVEKEQLPDELEAQPENTLEFLVKLVGKPNIADHINENLLQEMGSRVVEQFDEDWSSMHEWSDTVEKGIKLMKQEFKTKSVPWERASNFKSPLLSEASTGFGNRASLELLRGPKLIKAAIIGKDPEGQKKQRADRVTEAMNYQLNYEMDDWRKDQKRLLYTLPNHGCMFKQTIYNPLERINESHVIQYPDFAVNQATTSMKKCRSFTKICAISQNEVYERQQSKLWSDIEIYPSGAQGDEGSNEKEGVIDAEKNPDRFLEQQCFFDIDNDGYDEPYIVTVHEMTRKVVRVVARFDESSFVVKLPNGRLKTLKQAVIDDVKKKAMAGDILEDEPDLSQYELIRINPFQPITKYGFIPAPDGTFLDLGYSHLLGAITQGINTTTNQLTDAGTLRNLGGGFLAKRARKKMGPLKMRIGEWVSTEFTPENFRNSFLPNPQPEPSQVLLALNQKLEQEGRQFAAVTEAANSIQPNTAPTTALAIIQENLIATSALLGRILDAETDEFKVMYHLNQRYFDPELYKEILDDPQASSFADFNSINLDIQPTANAEMSSKLQRIQLATIQMEQFDRVIQTGGNAKVILTNFFEAIGSQNTEQIFPDQSTLTPEEQQQMQQLQQQQQQLADQQKQQNALTGAQVQLAKGELDRLRFRTQVEAMETIEKIEKLKAEKLLTLEKAETENIKNQVDTYTASLSALNEMQARLLNLTQSTPEGIPINVA